MKLTKQKIEEAYENLSSVVKETPLEMCNRLSSKYNADVYLKREDLQHVRSYKLRGAYNFMSNIKEKEVVCASAGNHAQGVAFAAHKLKKNAKIYMPTTTPTQKINKVRQIGGSRVETVLFGDTFDDSAKAAKEYSKKHSVTFVHPFDDIDVASGQGTVALEVCKQLGSVPDVLMVPVGGGGLLSGTVTYLKDTKTKIYAVEPEGARSLAKSLSSGKRVTLPQVDSFVDGASVREVGKLGFEIARDNKIECLPVPEGKLCGDILDLYQLEGIVTEPAGALSVAALDYVPKNKLEGKKVVCLVTGGNNDLSRYPEMIERSLIYKGLKHYFLINFYQKPGSLKRFINNILGPNDDITLFEYIKKNNRESGPALVGLEFQNKSDLEVIKKKLANNSVVFQDIKPDSALYKFLM